MYNAGSVICESLTLLARGLSEAGICYEIILVDDGSGADTVNRLAGISCSNIRVLLHPSNRGKGAALKLGLKLAEGNWIIYTDHDVPYGVEAVRRCYQELERGATVAIGDRTLPSSQIKVPVSLIRRFLSGIYSGLIRLLLLDSGIKDTQCGIKGFEAGFAKQLVHYSRVRRFAFDLELIVFAVENGIRIMKMPVALERNEPSSMRLVTDSLDMFKDLIRIAWHRSQGHYRILRNDAMHCEFGRAKDQNGGRV